MPGHEKIMLWCFDMLPSPCGSPQHFWIALVVWDFNLIPAFSIKPWHMPEGQLCIFSFSLCGSHSKIRPSCLKTMPGVSAVKWDMVIPIQKSIFEVLVVVSWHHKSKSYSLLDGKKQQQASQLSLLVSCWQLLVIGGNLLLLAWSVFVGLFLLLCFCASKQ